MTRRWQAKVFRVVPNGVRWLAFVINRSASNQEWRWLRCNVLFVGWRCLPEPSVEITSVSGRKKSERKNERRSKLSAFRRVLRPKHPNHLSRNKNTKIFLVSSLKQLGSSPRWRAKKWKRPKKNLILLTHIKSFDSWLLPFFSIVFSLFHLRFRFGSVISEWILTILKNLQAGWKDMGDMLLSLLHLLHGWRRTSPWFFFGFFFLLIAQSQRPNLILIWQIA